MTLSRNSGRRLFPNPCVRLPQWGWLDRFDRWRLERGILTGRWTEQEVADQKRRARELANRLQERIDGYTL